MAWACGMTAVSPRFDVSVLAGSPRAWPIVWLLMGAAVIWLAAMAVQGRVPPTRAAVGYMFAVGLLMRLALLPSTPILEDDYHRYLWDGLVTARGSNPYTHAPADAWTAFAPLAPDAAETLRRVNHPEYRSIYPPVAQGAFAVAHVIRPFSLTAWRAVVIVFELVTVLLLVVMLRELRRSAVWAAVYWWNPLIVKEMCNSAHMDAVVGPFVMAALLLMAKRRPIAAATALGVGIGAKLWPIVLAPLIVHVARGNRRTQIVAAATMLGTLVAALWPMAAGGFGDSSSLAAYAKSWQNNDAAFALLIACCVWLLGAVGLSAGIGFYAARGVAAMVVGAISVWAGRCAAIDAREVVRRASVVVAALCLLSPTQFPWYYAWLVPFLALRPRWSLMLYTAMLPLYYVSYDQPWVIAFEHGPVWVALGIEVATGRWSAAAEQADA